MRTVYLAGPIFGCDLGEANDWRDQAGKWFAANAPYVRCISPLRCEELPGERYNIGPVDRLFGTDEAIAAKNIYDVGACDMTLAYLPRVLNERRPSYGTVCEIAWAKMALKPVALVTDDPLLLRHPVIKACCGWRVESMEDGLRIVAGLFRDYP